MAPKIVEMAVKNTGAVPNLFLLFGIAVIVVTNVT